MQPALHHLLTEKLCKKKRRKGKKTIPDVMVCKSYKLLKSLAAEKFELLAFSNFRI